MGTGWKVAGRQMPWPTRIARFSEGRIVLAVRVRDMLTLLYSAERLFRNLTIMMN